MTSAEILTAREIFQRLPKRIKKKECLHPKSPTDCKGKIVKAHSVQRKLLKTIANKTHFVYKPDLSKTDSLTMMKLRGIKQASTFTGYCAYHDDKLFAPIEKHALELSEHHAFLLAYRSMGREIHVNEDYGSLSYILFPETPAISNPGEHPISGIFWEFEGNDNPYLKDFEVFARMGVAYLEGDFGETRYYAIELDSVPGILCSGTTNIEFDFNGNRLQSATQINSQDLITLSLLPYRNKYGVAILAWYGESGVNERFVKSLASLPTYDIPDAIVRFIFQHFDNFFASPRWWDNLSATAQQRLLERFESTFYAESYVFIDLGSDDWSYVDWNITGVKTNLKL